MLLMYYFSSFNRKSSVKNDHEDARGLALLSWHCYKHESTTDNKAEAIVLLCRIWRRVKHHQQDSTSLHVAKSLLHRSYYVHLGFYQLTHRFCFEVLPAHQAKILSQVPYQNIAVLLQNQTLKYHH